MLNGATAEQYAALLGRAAQRGSTIGKILGAGNLLSVRPLRATDVFSVLRKMWAHEAWEKDREGFGRWRHSLPSLDGRSAPFPAYFLLEDVEEQFGLFRVGRVWHRIMTVHTLPEEADIALIPFALSSGEVTRDLRNMHLAMVLKPADKAVEYWQARERIDLLTGQMKGNPIRFGDNAGIIADLVKRRSELRNAARPSMVDCHYQIHFWDRDLGKLEERERILKSVLESSCGGMQIEGEDVNALPFCLGFGQPGYTRMKDLSRSHAMLPVEAAVLAPLGVNSTGIISNSPGAAVPLLFETDMGTSYGIDIFAKDRVFSYGGIGIGPSGSGKTNLYQNLIISEVGRDTDIVIIDGADRPSFPTLTQLIGGTYYNVAKDLTFNIMGTRIIDGVQQSPDQDELSGMISSFAPLLQRDGEAFEPLEAAVLTKGIKRAFEHRVDTDGMVRLEHLAPAMNPQHYESSEEKEIAGRYKRIIEDTGIGRFGSMLNCPDRLPNHKYVTFEVKELFVPGQEQLCSIVVSLLFRHIDRLTRDNIEKKRRTLVIIDEAWKALLKPTMLQLVISLYRTGRARWVSPHLLSQSTEDVKNLMMLTEKQESKGQYESSPILEASSHVFLFGMDGAGAKVAADTFRLNANQQAQLVNLGGVDGKYREFAYSCKVSENTPRTFTVLRSRPLPATLWATSTEPTQQAERAAMRDEVRALIANPVARLALTSEMNQQGWGINGQVPENQFIDAATVFQLAKRQRK